MKLAACGNDCSVCPRFLPKTSAELRETAELWMKIGYRDHIVSIEEISCTGCKVENWCRYGIVSCTEQRKITSCAECTEYPCDKLLECFRLTEAFSPKCREVCSDKEYSVITKAFFEKRKNLEAEREMLGDNMIRLVRAGIEDAGALWKMQIEAFAALLEKYQDGDRSPGAEKVEKIVNRLSQPFTYYYFIVSVACKVGAIRVVDYKDGRAKRISPLYILPEFRGKGYAQAAIKAAEEIHGSSNWELDTILQEEGNCHLYEKMGYRLTGKSEIVNERMTLVDYRKE